MQDPEDPGEDVPEREDVPEGTLRAYRQDVLARNHTSLSLRQKILYMGPMSKS